MATFGDTFHQATAFELAALGDPIIEELVEILWRGDFEVSGKAAAALAYMGDKGLQHLVDAVLTGPPKVRNHALRGLSLGGEPATPYLEQLLYLGDENFSTTAAVSLAGWFTFASTGVRPPLERNEDIARLILANALSSPDSVVSESAAAGLAYLGGDDLQYALGQLPLQGFVLEGIDTTVYERNMEHLIFSLESLEADLPLHRVEAARTLRRKANPLTVPFLSRSLTNESDPTARAEKMAALWRTAHSVLPSRSSESADNQPPQLVTDHPAFRNPQVSPSSPVASDPGTDNRVLKGKWDYWILVGAVLFVAMACVILALLE